MSSIISLDHEIVQLPDTAGMLWVYQTSQCNWVTIKVHYRYLWKCLLGWHGSRLGFVTPDYEEVSLGPLGSASYNELKVTKCLVMGSCITVRVKWLVGNEIEWGIGIPTIGSRTSNILIDKGNCIRGCLNPRHRGSPDEIIMEHMGANMGIQILLLVIDRRVISVMSACLPNP